MNEFTYIKKVLAEEELYLNASRTVEFDQATVCPPGGMEEKSELIAFLEQQAFRCRRDKTLTEHIISLYEKRDSLDEWERALVEQRYRAYLMEKNISPEQALSFTRTEKKAFVDWGRAKDADDFSLFRDSLAAVIQVNRERSALRELTDAEAKKMTGTYDRLLDVYERGMTQDLIDPCFAECRERITKLLRRIQKSKKQIRTDFLSRPVPEDQQRQVTEYLMDVLCFDKDRGTFSTSKHGYTERLSENDIRITTHFYPGNFLANVYTVLHETGHALFDQLQPTENSAYFLTEGKTLGMHESVSRFYENRIGRSEDFIHLIYPRMKELLPEALAGVSERELYEGVNLVQPSLIRIQADEVTYSLHIIIRYELEKELFEGNLTVDELPKAWDDKYEEILGIRPTNRREGVLQDVHWASDFGYFPTYLLGNLYNAMYYNKMKEEIDVQDAIRSGEIAEINGWMQRNVFLKADRLSPADWLFSVTGRALSANDFLSYLEEKYERLYEL